jgi:hypothetical protein
MFSSLTLIIDQLDNGYTLQHNFDGDVKKTYFSDIYSLKAFIDINFNEFFEKQKQNKYEY